MLCVIEFYHAPFRKSQIRKCSFGGYLGLIALTVLLRRDVRCVTANPPYLYDATIEVKLMLVHTVHRQQCVKIFRCMTLKHLSTAEKVPVHTHTTYVNIYITAGQESA